MSNREPLDVPNSIRQKVAVVDALARALVGDLERLEKLHDDLWVEYMQWLDPIAHAAGYDGEDDVRNAAHAECGYDVAVGLFVDLDQYSGRLLTVPPREVAAEAEGMVHA